MGRVVSVGSINVDRIRECDAETLSALAERYEWFPDPGETVHIDRVPETLVAGSYDRRLGGKGANQAVAAARAGATTRLFGTVGSDAADLGVRDTLRERGVDASTVAEAPVETGTAYVFVGPDGESHVAVHAGANARTNETYLERHESDVAGADVLLLQNEIPVAAMDALLDSLADVENRPLVVLDPAPVGGVEKLVDRVDVLTPNEGEYEALAPHLDAFDGTVVHTRGGDDVAVTGLATFRVTPPRVEPVDATGAGDTFAGYLAAQLAGGAPLPDAVEVATVAGALATTAVGAQSAIPTLGDVYEVVDEHEARNA